MADIPTNIVYNGDVNPVVIMDIRALTRDRLSIVCTHKNGDKIGNVVTVERSLEMIDEIIIR